MFYTSSRRTRVQLILRAIADETHTHTHTLNRIPFPEKEQIISPFSSFFCSPVAIISQVVLRARELFRARRISSFRRARAYDISLSLALYHFRARTLPSRDRNPDSPPVTPPRRTRHLSLNRDAEHRNIGRAPTRVSDHARPPSQVMKGAPEASLVPVPPCLPPAETVPRDRGPPTTRYRSTLRTFSLQTAH